MSVKKIATLGVLLAIMLVFQLMKGISPYITGPVVNIVIIISTYYVSLYGGLLLSIIAPITSMLITPGITGTIHEILPCIIIGNIILCMFLYFLKNKNLTLALFLGSTLKGIFMTISIVLIIIPAYAKGVGAPIENFELPRQMFSLTQFITAYIASAISLIVIKRMKIK